MSQLLKVDEWQSPSKCWYVADVHTWTGWNEMADILGMESLDSFIDCLTNTYEATIDKYVEEKDYLMFHWESNKYAKAHKFKLDVNRIARKKGYMV